MLTTESHMTAVAIPDFVAGEKANNHDLISRQKNKGANHTILL